MRHGLPHCRAKSLADIAILDSLAPRINNLLIQGSLMLGTRGLSATMQRRNGADRRELTGFYSPDATRVRVMVAEQAGIAMTDDVSLPQGGERYHRRAEGLAARAT
jgi:hypothetical protein